MINCKEKLRRGFIRRGFVAMPLAWALVAGPVVAQGTPSLATTVNAVIAKPDAALTLLASYGRTLPAEEAARLMQAAAEGDSALVRAILAAVPMAPAPEARASTQAAAALGGMGALAAVGAGGLAIGAAALLGGNSDGNTTTAATPAAATNPCSNVANLGQLSGCTPGNATIINGLAAAMQGNSEFRFSNSGSLRGGGTAHIAPAELIKAQHAHGMGLTGKGITLSIFDDGFNAEHPDLKNKIRYLDLPGVKFNVDDHGSNVAALAVGERGGGFGQGIAYDAKAIVSATDPRFPTQYGLEFITMAARGATVSSNSYGFNEDFQGSASDKEDYFTVQDEVQYDKFQQYMADKGVDAVTAMSDLFIGSKAEWQAYLAAFRGYQTANGGRGVILWANSNNGPFGIAAAKNNGTTGTALARSGMTDVDSTASFPLIDPSLEGAWITVSNVVPKEVLEARLRSGNFDAATINQIFADLDAKYKAKYQGRDYTLASAPCGAAGRFCMSMDGGEVRAAGKTGAGYVSQLGTSQATPQLAGAIAILQQAFPNLSGKDIVTRLFVTADNTWFNADQTASFDHGLSHKYNDVFGHGFADLQKALAPVGKTVVTTVADSNFTLSDGSSRIRASDAFGADLGARAADAQFIQADVMRAGFAASVGDYVIDDTTRFAEDMLATWSGDTTVETLTLGDDAVVSFASTTALDARGQEVGEQSWHFSADLGGGLIADVAAGSTLDGALGFRAEGTDRGIIAASDGGFDIPFLSLAEDDAYWGAITDRGAKGDLTFGAFSGSDEDFDSYGMVMQQSWRPLEGTELLATGGLVMERGGMLGTKTSGAFANDESSSVFGRIGARAELGAGFAVKGAYTMAQTRADADGLFTGFSPVMSDTFALSLEKQGLAMEKDHAAITLSQPVRALSGQASMMLPTGYDSQWNYTYSEQDIDLTPDARELRLTASWAAEVSPGIRLDLGAAIVKDAGHVARDDLDYGGFVGLRFDF